MIDIFHEYHANVICPDGFWEIYSVFAKSKTEARKKIAKVYRENTPPKSAGFYTFAECQLKWIEQ